MELVKYTRFMDTYQYVNLQDVGSSHDHYVWQIYYYTYTLNVRIVIHKYTEGPMKGDVDVNRRGRNKHYIPTLIVGLSEQLP